MSKISSDAILKLGVLARLGIDQDLAGVLAPQLQLILDYVAQLDKLETADVEITTQVTGLVDVWREDVVVASVLSQSELLQNAPATKNGYIKVKRVKE